MSDDLSGDMLAPSWPNLVYISNEHTFPNFFMCLGPGLRKNNKALRKLWTILWIQEKKVIFESSIFSVFSMLIWLSG